MKKPVIAFLSDFGLSDPYSGVVKGVIISLCQEVDIIDLTHEVPAHDIIAGAIHLQSAVPYFPEGTIFLAVVDPGVGGGRLPIMVRGKKHFYVGPDNGLLSLAIEEDSPYETFTINDVPSPGPVSGTFHGRDIFAPAAALLAKGVPPEEIGSIHPSPVRLGIPSVIPEGNKLQGEVIHIDHFGNLVTNFRPEDLKGTFDPLISIVGHNIKGISKNYSEVGEGETLALWGSTGHLEISIHKGRAGDLPGIRKRTPVSVLSRHEGG
ncbi:MAG: SAM-dependent chlorinase/fluorinase [Chloroflexi bacterium]|nr:SAM-dependent chlorinase/fluorinase [Chloroflexota bacterium]